MFRMELKKIFSKKINRFVIAATFLIAAVCSGFAVSGNRFVDENGTMTANFTDTRKLEANKNQWKGTLTEEILQKAFRQDQKGKSGGSLEEQNQNYGRILQPIDDIKTFLISVLNWDSEYDESVLDQMTEDQLGHVYDIYRANMANMAEEYGRTPEQRNYLEKQYSKIKLPLEYEAYDAWDTMILYSETYATILAIAVGFLCAGIFADDFRTKADAVFFATKYGRTKAVKTKILAGLFTTTILYWAGMAVLSLISFGIMGTSGMNTPYQMYEPYSIYIMTYGQYYLLALFCGYIASLLAASLSMLAAARMHTVSFAVCIPFFLYCLLPFIGRALSRYTAIFNLIPTVLTNVEASAKVPLFYQIGGCVFRQIPLVMGIYLAVSVLVLPLIYFSWSSISD